MQDRDIGRLPLAEATVEVHRHHSRKTQRSAFGCDVPSYGVPSVRNGTVVRPAAAA